MAQDDDVDIVRREPCRFEDGGQSAAGGRRNEARLSVAGVEQDDLASGVEDDRRKAGFKGRFRPMDRRLRYALQPLGRVWRSDLERADAPVPSQSVAALAMRAGLSTSRFQHLFSQQMGVPFRRYRSWVRMRRAIHEIVEGANFTDAAYAAGYADQAHFAHDFRRTFGAPASRSLKGLKF